MGWWGGAGWFGFAASDDDLAFGVTECEPVGVVGVAMNGEFVFVLAVVVIIALEAQISRVCEPALAPWENVVNFEAAG